MASSKNQIHFVRKLPDLFGPDSVLIYDRKLVRAHAPFKKWASRFSAAYGVQAGETLKDLRAFPAHMEKLLKLTSEMSPRRMTVVVAGGGSVGDFGGFVASIFKRGVRLVHVPSTWLAAIDSSHGGKTALNVWGGKNQIGTFYMADDVYLVGALLASQPEARSYEACGELAKIALIDGRSWVGELEASAGTPTEFLAGFLPYAIDSKLRVVNKDPREESGVRQALNLGHTLGHVLEASMGIPHGVAVAQGLFFALDWSAKRGTMNARTHLRADKLMARLGLFRLTEEAQYRRARPTVAQARKLLLQDKKRDQPDAVTFVFLERVGSVVRENVSLDELLKEAREQGWLR